MAALVALSLAALLFRPADALAGHRGQVFIGNGFAFGNRPVFVPRSNVIIVERPFVRRHFFVPRPIIVGRPIIIGPGFVTPGRQFFISPFCPFP
jgi:hypothetical protein